MGRRDNPVLEDGNVGSQLRLTRQRAGVNLSQFAEDVGYSKGYLSLIENGKVKAPKKMVDMYQKHFASVDTEAALKALEDTMRRLEADLKLMRRAIVELRKKIQTQRAS